MLTTARTAETQSPTDAGAAQGQSDRDKTTLRLLATAQTAEAGERKRLLDEVVVLNMGLARAIASRYRDRGIPEEDLLQAAYMGLVKAAQRFDPSSGEHFMKFAVPTIAGEVKHTFRDTGWMVRPPRTIQELQPKVVQASAELARELNRSPKPREVAQHLGVHEEQVIEALSAQGCFSPESLEKPVLDGTASLGDLLGGADDGGYARAEARLLLSEAFKALSDRDRRIIALRFFEGRTQSQIAQDLGVSQMQVSRLLVRILRDLRRQLADA